MSSSSNKFQAILQKYIKKFDWLKFYLTPNRLVYSSKNGKVVIEEI